MVDSVQVLPAGFRVLDVNGDPVSGAKIKFREAGPGAELDVYADSDLSTSLGDIVYTRSDGYPVIEEGSNTVTLIYTGADPYNIEITDADDVAIFTAQDNVRGALDTSSFLTDSDVSTLSISSLSIVGDTTIGADHNGKVLNVNSSSGIVTLTFDSAITLGDGFNVEVRHDTGTNPVRIVATQSFNGPWGDKNAFTLLQGESIAVRSDGATFKIAGYTPPFIKGTVGVLTIINFAASEPASPVSGSKYIATAVFTAGGITTAIGDIIEATGQNTWIKVTPQSDCGWIAYVQSEGLIYQYIGTAWVSLLQRSTGSVKAYGTVLVSGGAATLQFGSLNIASVVRNSTGNYTINFTNALTSAVYMPFVQSLAYSSTLAYSIDVASQTTSSCVVAFWRSTSSGSPTLIAFDNSFSFAAFGTLA